MDYKMAVCDDSGTDCAYMEQLVQAWAAQTGNRADLRRFPSAESFLFAYAQEKDFDVLLLDIEMPGMDGVQLARRVRAENRLVQIVFITGYPDFIAEGYEVAALHYLMKPVSQSRLSAVLDRAAENLNKCRKSVILSAENGTVRVALEDIVSVEAFAHTCAVVTAGETLTVRQSIGEMEALLGDAAVRCHRSYLAGLRFIRRITRSEVLLDNGTALPLARAKYAAVNQAFIRFYKGAME